MNHLLKFYALLIVGVILLLTSCEKYEVLDEQELFNQPEIGVQAPGEYVQISYYGKKITVKKWGDDYLLGDMSLTPDNELPKADPGAAKGPSVDPIRGAHFLWPNGEIPYVIDPELIRSDNFVGTPGDRTNKIMQAIQILEEKTNVRFKERSTERNYVRFYPSIFAQSKIGRQPLIRNGQKVHLTLGIPLRTVIHEIGHALGLHHEQNASGRDSDIIIHYDNLPSDTHDQYAEISSSFHSNASTNFDYESIMLYPSFASFAIDTSKPVMTRLNGSTWDVNHSLSAGDIAAINRMYPGNTGGYDGGGIPSNINDIAGHWAVKEISHMVNNGLMAGTGNNLFEPNKAVTRAEFAVMISNVIDPPPSSDPAVSNRNFQDLGTVAWARERILKVARAGYLAGDGNGNFRPLDKITKLEITLAISNGLGLNGGTSGSLNVFTDRGQIPNWAISSIANATHNGFIANYPNISTFVPGRDATRADATVTMYQALRHLGRAVRIENSYVVNPQ